MVVELIRSVGKRRFPLIVRDAQPLEKFEGMWRVGAQVAVIGLFFLACIAALEYARPILLPVVSAFMLGMMLGPLSSLGERLRIPPVVTAVFLWLLVIAIFYGIVMLLSAPLIEWAGKGTELGQIIKGKLSVLDRPIAMIQELRTALFPRAKDQPEVAFNFVSVLQPAVLFLTPAIGQAVIFLGTLFFFLLGRTQLRQMMVVFFKKREARLRMLRILNDIEHNLTSYLTLVTLINAVVGVIAFVLAYAVGLPSPIVCSSFAGSSSGVTGDFAVVEKTCAISSSDASSAQWTSSRISTTGEPIAIRCSSARTARYAWKRSSCRPPAATGAAEGSTRASSPTRSPISASSLRSPSDATWSSSASTQIANGSSLSSSAPRPTNTG